MVINYNKYSPEYELASLPINYTLEMALSNNDVVYDFNKNYNTEKFYKFLENVNNGIPDKIRIASYGVDGPATISILLYDGYLIRNITDVSRFGIHQYYDSYGYQIVSRLRNSLSGRVLEDYILLTVDNKTDIIYKIFLH